MPLIHSAPFAYIEWFSAFPTRPNSNHQMYKVSRTFRPENVDLRHAAVVPLENILRTVHLIPVFGPNVDRTLSSSNVLERCTEFYVNHFLDEHMYMTLH